MNATELFLAEGKTAGIFFCANCRYVAASQERAEQCCKNYLCSRCGKDTGSRHYLVCDDCRRIKRAEEERERFVKAEKITEWAGWVFSGEEFYESIQHLQETLEPEEWPEYVWATTENHFVQARIGHLTERMGDDAYEDWDPRDLNGLPELQAALDKFNEVNQGVVSYTPDYSKAMVLKKEEAAKGTP